MNLNDSSSLMDLSLKHRVHCLYQVMNHSSDWLCVVNHDPQSDEELSFQTISYREFVERSVVLAIQLKKLAPLHARVLVSIAPSLELYITHLACILADFTPAIFHTPNPKQKLIDYQRMCVQIISSGTPHLVITDTSALPYFKTDQTAEPLVKCHNEFSSDREAFTLDLFAELLASPPPEISILQYSSGTTGAKKGVIFRSQELLKHIDCLAQVLKIRGDDHVVSWLPLYHDMGFIACWMMPLLTGIQLSSISPYQWVRAPHLLFEIIKLRTPTLCWMPNFAFSLISKRVSPDPDRYDLSSLRQIISCSEYISYQTMRTFLHTFARIKLSPQALSTSYAMAENIFAVTQHTQKHPLKLMHVQETSLALGQVVSCYSNPNEGTYLLSSGSAIPGVQIVILDSQHQELDELNVGYIAYQSKTLFGGYLLPAGEDHLQHHDTRVGNYYVTRDLGFLCKGELFVLGRTDDVMIIGGKNIYPYDIEAILNETPELYPGRSVALSASCQQEGTQEVVVLAEVREISIEKRHHLKLHLKQKITTQLNIPLQNLYLLPHMTLSKSTSGKLSRGKNKNRYLKGELEEHLWWTLPNDISASTINQDSSEQLKSLSHHLQALSRALETTLSIPYAGFSPHTALFSTSLLDSFNTHLFFDELAQVYGESCLQRLKFEIENLDSLKNIAEWLDREELKANLNQTNETHTNRTPTEPLSPNRMTFFSYENARLSYQAFELTTHPFEEMKWFVSATQLNQVPNKRPLRSGGIIEAPNIKSPSISTTPEGFRVTLDNQGRVLSRVAWQKYPQRGLIFGNSATFGIGVDDSETFPNILIQLAPHCGWMNYSARAATLDSILQLVENYKDHQADYIVVFGSSDFKQFGDQLRALEISEVGPTLQKVWEQWKLRYITTLRRLIKCTRGRLIFVHHPSIVYDDKMYNTEEAQGFWCAEEIIPDYIFENYFSFHPLLKSLRAQFSESIMAECQRAQVLYLNYAHDPLFLSAEKLYHDCSHYTPLMHSLIALRLGQDLGLITCS